MPTKEEDTANTVDDSETDYDTMISSDESVETENNVSTVKELSTTETNRVHLSRRLLLSVMILMGALVTTSVFVGVKERNVDESFETYTVVANALAASAVAKMSAIVLAFDTMSETITKNTSVNGAEAFPFVKVPHFEMTGHVARSLSGIDRLIYAPYVHWGSVGVWAEYSLEMSGTQDKDVDEKITPYIFQYAQEAGQTTRSKIDAINRGFYAPIWQVTPPPEHPSSSINLNLASELSLYHVFKAICEAPGGGLISNTNQYINSMLGNSIFDDDNQRTAFKLKADRPKSAFAQPVIHHPSHHRADDSFVGMVVGEIDWGRLFFADIMPFGSSGIYMVLRNSCGKAFTYFVNEENGEPVYMGPGDLHEPGFESTEVTTRLTTVDTQGIEKIKGHCVYSISFYSSSQFREKFKKDFWFAPLIATAFALVCCAFIRYDRMVNHRIDKVIRTAARFNAILGKMYASNLRSLAASSPRKKKALSRCEWRSQMEPLTILEDVSSSAVDGADEIIMEQKGPPAPLFQDGNLRRPHPSFEVV